MHGMYSLHLFSAGAPGPTRVVVVDRADAVLRTITGLFEANPDCAHVEVLAGHARLFTVDRTAPAPPP